MMRHGSTLRPPNRYERVHTVLDNGPDDRGQRIEYLDDQSQTIVAQNRSPDIPFRYSVNPYRGCIHGCSYCYARPTHEYLGFGAGIDFETKVIVKRDAANLFEMFLAKKSWRCEPISFSGVTDCYQPAERSFQLTRKCVEVALQCRQPIGIVTKNALVARDLDLLSEMAALRLVHVFISITTLDSTLARDMEPRTSTPQARLGAMRSLATAGIPVGVMVAPIIPGLNDDEIPGILKAASQAGASAAGSVLLRLPLTVRPVFLEWLQRSQPDKYERVVGRLRQTRGGQLNQSDFGQRMRGSGEIAIQIENLMKLFRRKYRLDGTLPEYDCGQFRRPRQQGTGQQLRLF